MPILAWQVAKEIGDGPLGGDGPPGSNSPDDDQKPNGKDNDKDSAWGQGDEQDGLDWRGKGKCL